MNARKNSRMMSSRSRCGILAAAAASALTPVLARAQVSYVTPGSSYTQDFNTLPASGTSTNGQQTTVYAVPGQPDMTGVLTGGYTPLQGWYLGDTSIGDTSTHFLIGTGSLTTGSTMSYGTGSSTERSLGALSSANENPVFGVALTNTTGSTLTQFTLQFTGEQWRQTANAQSLGFSYFTTGSFNSADLTTAGTAFSGLDFTAIKTGTAGALDGNASGNFGVKIGTVSGLTWAPGETLWLKWGKSGTTSPGLAIDDLSFSALAARNLVWNPGSTTWNTTNTNWLDPTNPTVYGNGDVANFTGTPAPGTVTVQAGGVLPGGVNISNSTGTYTFTGGSISGNGTLIMSGAGTANLTATNGYSGGTTINGGGTINVVGGDDRLGAASGGITLDNASTIRTVTTGLTSARSINVAAGGGTFDTNGLNSTTTGNLSGSGAFTKSGAGNLTISGGWSFNGKLGIGTGGSLTMSMPTATYTFSADAGGNTFQGNLNIANAMRLNILSGIISGGGAINVQATGSAIATAPVGAQTLEIDNNINLNSNNVGGAFVTAIGGTGSGNLTTINGVISGNSDVQFGSGLTGGGAATLVINTPMTYTGQTIINNAYAVLSTNSTGVLKLGVNDAFPTGTAVTFGSPNPPSSTSVDAGTINLAGFNQRIASLSSRVGSLVNGITNDSGTESTLTIQGSANTTYAGTIGSVVASNLGGGSSIALTLSATNTGTLTLTGTANDYSGATTISGGRLNVNGVQTGAGAVNVSGSGSRLGGTGSLAGTVTASSSGKVSPGIASSVGTLTLSNGANFATGGQYEWELGAFSTGSGFDQLAVTGGNLTLGGSSNISIGFDSPATNPDAGNPFWTSERLWKVIDFSGGGSSTGNFASLTGASFTAGSFTTLTGTGADAGDIFVKYTPVVAGGRNLTWDGASGGSPSDADGTWTAANKWFNGVADTTWSSSPADLAYFGANGGNAGITTVTVTTGVTVREMTFNANSNNYLITGGTVTLNGPSTVGVTVLNSAEIASALNVATSRTFDIETGQTLTLSGVTSGATSVITKVGAGTLALNNAGNTFAGLTITAGTVTAGSNGALGASSGTLTFNGGTLQATGVISAPSRPIVVNATGTFDSNSNNATFGGAISGTGTLAVIGGGTVSLTNAGNSVSGISATGIGTVLSVGASGNLGSSTSTVSLGTEATLRLGSGFDSSAVSGRTLTLVPGSNPVSIDVPTGSATLGGMMVGLGTMVLNKTGPGELVLAGLSAGATPTNFRNATTEVVGGTLTLSAVSDHDATHHNVSMLGIGRITVDSNATLQINNVDVGLAGDNGGNTVFMQDSSTLKGIGNASITKSGGPAVISSASNVTFTTGGSSDVLTIGASIRNDVSAATSTATIHINGSGRVYLASGPTSTSTNTDHFNGQWAVDSGTLEVGPVIGTGQALNALGYTYGPDAIGTGAMGGGTPVTVNSAGTLVSGIDRTITRSSSNAASGTLVNPITFNSGALGATNGDPAFSGNLTFNGNPTIKTTDVVDTVSPRTIHLETTAFVNGDINWGGGTVDVTGSGTLNFNRASGTVTVAPGSVLKIEPGATVNLDNTQDALNGGANLVNVLNNSTASLHIKSGIKHVGTVTGSGNTTVDPATMLVANSVTQNKVIMNGYMVLHSQAAGTATGTQYNGVTGLIQTGRNGNTVPLWDGATGIVTNQTAATTGNYNAIGVAKATDVRPATATATTTWAGQTITGTDTLVMYTYGGDATLDGKINIDDYVKIDSGISAGLTGWSNGDFNYDGKVSIDDYITVIDANINNQNGIFPTAGGIGGEGGGPSGVSAVPEPASISVLSLGAVAMLSRRRRRIRSCGMA